MSNTKLTKFLQRPFAIPIGNQIYTPLVFSDSKGKWLEKKVNLPPEKHIQWLAKSGESCMKGYNGIKSKLK
jgi:hypothetical protein